MPALAPLILSCWYPFVSMVVVLAIYPSVSLVYELFENKNQISFFFSHYNLAKCQFQSNY